MAEPAKRGRKRDPALEDRVLEAAVTVLRQRGVEGFSYEAVAREADVGKPALYLRWESKRDLMLDALESKAHKILVDTGDVREDLTRFVIDEIRDLVSQNAMALLRLLVDAAANPEDNRDLDHRVIRAFHVDAQQLLKRAIERGQLPPDTGGMIFDLLYGACISHVLVTPLDRRARMLTRVEGFARSTVDLVLAGAWAQSSETERAPQRRL